MHFILAGKFMFSNAKDCVFAKLIAMKLRCCLRTNVNPRHNRHNLIRFLQVVFCAEQANILHRKTTATFGERNIVIVVQIDL